MHYTSSHWGADNAGLKNARPEKEGPSRNAASLWSPIFSSCIFTPALALPKRAIATNLLVCCVTVAVCKCVVSAAKTDKPIDMWFGGGLGWVHDRTWTPCPPGRGTFRGYLLDTNWTMDVSSLRNRPSHVQPIARSRGVTPRRCGLSLSLM